MTRCDHGLTLDVPCGECEEAFAAYVARNEVWYRESRSRSSLIAALCLLVAGAVVLIVAMKGYRL